MVCIQSTYRDMKVFAGLRRNMRVGLRVGKGWRGGMRGGCFRLRRRVLGGACCLYKLVETMADRGALLWVSLGHVDMLLLGRRGMARTQELGVGGKVAVLSLLMSCERRMWMVWRCGVLVRSCVMRWVSRGMVDGRWR